MKREIKFRGKVECYNLMPNPKNGWVKGYYFQNSMQGEMSSFIFQPPYNWEVIPETVGQFTGLLDKNGKEIYEGDIIRYTDIDSFVVNPDCDPCLHFRKSYAIVREAEVVFENGMFRNDEGQPICYLGWESIKDLMECLGVTDDDDCDVNGTIVDDSLLGIEVIGNIHDNPEL